MHCCFFMHTWPAWVACEHVVQPACNAFLDTKKYGACSCEVLKLGLESAMVTLGTKHCITWEGRTATLPEDFVTEIGGANYVKFQPSHRMWVKLLLGDGRTKSLSSSKGVEVLKQKRDKAFLQHFQTSGGDKLFADTGENSKGSANKEPPLFVMVEEIQIGIAPRHNSKRDLLILLEENTLERVFNLAIED